MALSGSLSCSLTGDFDAGCGGSAPLPLETIALDLVSYYDSSQNDRRGSNHMTLSGQPELAVGKITAYCVDFESTSGQFFTLLDGAAGDFEPDQDISYAAWFKPESIATSLIIISKGLFSDCAIYVGVGGTLTARWGSVIVALPAASIPVGSWSHVYVNWDNATNTLSVSLNGAALVTATGAAVSANAFPFRIGGDSSSGSSFDGLIDQLCVWHRPLTDAELAALYNAGAGAAFRIRGGTASSDPAVSLNDGLITYYDTSGTIDRIGGNVLAAIGSPTTTAGKVSPLCIMLPVTGTNYFWAGGVAQSLDFRPVQLIAYSFWARTDALTSGANMHFSSGDNTSRTGRSFASTTGRWETNWNASTLTILGSNGDITVGPWNHFYVEFDPATNTVSRSMNGGALVTATGTPVGTSTSFHLGASAGAFVFRGPIDQFCVWHRLLTSDERAAIYNGGAGTDFFVP
jgi:hypothetical protein